MTRLPLSVIGAALVLLVGCSNDSASQGVEEPAPVEVTPPPYGSPWSSLSQWNLFTDGPGQTPADGVIPYEVNSPLFTDYATKTRFVFVPKGATIGYEDDTAWDFPVGTALVKTFAMPADLRAPDTALTLLETRVEFDEPDGWSLQTYVWDADQMDATLNIVGPVIPLDFKGEQGEAVHDDYTVPNSDECKECHQNAQTTLPLGPKTRQMNRTHDYGAGAGSENQIDHLEAAGLFAGAVPPASMRDALVDPLGSGSLSDRVRAYWDGNCSHCHTVGGYASQSSLLLDYLSTDPATNSSVNWGVCKMPTAAGGATCENQFDVVPGDPDHSIMVCRVGSTEGKVRMPPLGMMLLNQEALDLIRDWITSLAPTGCEAPTP
jgi:uncharacterized repeat protein (TIGR03806 family)